MVRSADGIYPYVMGPGGKLVKSNSKRFALMAVPEYMPIIVDVHGVNVRTNSISVGGSGNRINNEIDFHATMVSPANLDRVFVVLELSTDSGKSLFLWGIGRIQADTPKDLSLFVPTVLDMGSGHYHLHVFTDGVEVFNTTMGILNIDGYLDAMVSKRINGVTDARPATLMTTIPSYPKDLKKRHVKGQAVVSVRIDDRGRVQDQNLVSASDAAFGDSALAAVRNWRFVPLVWDGRAVGTVVQVPFTFDPDKGS